MPYKVILVGGGGLIGSHLLSELIHSGEISQILLILRKPMGIPDPKVRELIVNFDEPESYSTEIKGDIIYSCLKLKGELEGKLKKLKLPSLHIYQPSFLTGNRKEHRLAEKILNPLIRLIDPLLLGPLKKFRSIKAATVARAMHNQSLKDLKGTFIYPSIQIQELA